MYATPRLAAGLLACLLAAEPPQAVQPPAAKPVVSAETVRTGRVELLSRKAYGSYERACFSFAVGLRGDKCRNRVHNNYDILFGNGPDTFRVRTVTDDESLIRDLGARTFEQIDSLPELTAADSEPVQAIEGHAYLVLTKDRDHRGIALFRVTSLKPGDRCTIEWVAIPDLIVPPNALNMGADLRAKLGTQLAGQKIPEKPVPVLAAPRVRLQLRAGAGGGNPNRIDMAGEKSIYVDHVLPEPLCFDKPVTMDDQSVAYFKGGMIPLDKKFIITSVTWRGTAKGDTNGHGELIVSICGRELVKVRDGKKLIRGEWEGRIEILPGDEYRVFAEVANSSTVDVEIEGEFAPLESE